MNRLLMLNEEVVSQAARSTLRPATPIKALKKSLPIRPASVWQEVGGTLLKTFSFSSVADRNVFVYRLLGYEQDKGHNAELSITHDKVTVAVTTHDLGKITELDKEYSHAADAIFSEIQRVS